MVLVNSYEVTDDSELDGYLPLVEGKLFGQYNHRYASYFNDEVLTCSVDSRKLEQKFYRYIRKDTALRKNPRLIRERSLIAIRDITHSTNERGVIASVIPSRITDYTVRVVEGELSADKKCILLSGLNSLVIDFVARMRIGGNHLSNYIIYQLPLLSFDDYSSENRAFILKRVLELSYTDYDLRAFAEELGYSGEPFAFSPIRRHQLKCELDAYYAKLYGLTRDELRYILDPANVMGEDYPSETFRVLKNKELKEFGEFRTQRLVLAAWDKLERGELV